MNIQRYILPATVAATLHVALLWAIPDEEYVRLVPVILGPKDPPPPKTPEEVVMPPEEKTPDTKPVESLAGGPMPPEIPELPVKLRPEALSIPVDPHPRNIGEVTQFIPKAIGPGEIGSPTVVGVPLFSSGELDRVPNAKMQMAPDYPLAMKHGGIEGSVVVEFDVDRSGQVVGIRVLRSTHREFEEPTLRAVLKWRFEPGRRNGKAVPFRMQVPVDFHLE